VYPPEDIQGAADAVLAKRLGVRHPYVFLDDPNDGYGGPLAAAFATAARRLGLDVTGPESPRPRDGFVAVARRLRSEGVDGVFVGGLANDRTAEFIRAMRRGLGPKAVLIAPDGFLPAAAQVSAIGPEAKGMYVSGAVVTRPEQQLPPAGRRFSRKFRATQRGRPVDFFAPYAAQATEVLLKAIAHSDGSRASVARELLRVRLRDGIFGPFAFDRNGDPTDNLLPIFRVTKNAPEALYPDDRVVTVIRAPSRLVHQG
jgi:ABC-type branched-subunit amino acid transport system substrate-binding protein